MLYAGKKIETPNIEIVVIPRVNGNIVIKAKAVLDYTEHDALNPRPEPRKLTRPGQTPIDELDSPKYQALLNDWGRKKMDWMIIQSLKATEELAWETVNDNDSETWSNYQKELEEACFTPQEIMRIVDCVLVANGLNQTKIDEATKLFLAGQVAQSQ